jgi:hypothetical protein
MTRRSGFVVAALLLLGMGCSTQKEEIVMARQGQQATAEQIDRERWGLLPGGAVVWAEVDALALARAEYGRLLLDALRQGLPVASSSGQALMRNLARIRLAVYASQSGDVAAILEGQFDARAIETGVAEAPKNARGENIEHRSFAGFDLLSAGNMSMAVLTPETLALGTEVGVRRVLERVEEGRVRRALPNWFETLLTEKKASLWLGIDLDAQPVPATLRTQLNFLEKLRGARILGRFEPGLNLAGSLSYDSADSAHQALMGMNSQVSELNRAAFLLALLKVPRPLRQFDAEESGKKVDFVAEADARAVAMALGYLGQLGGQVALR